VIHSEVAPKEEDARQFDVRVLRQDGPGQPSYWQTFRLRHEPSLNITSVLQQIAAQPLTREGKRSAPVSYDSNCLEEVCGACTMLINGRVRQACSALVDRLLSDRPGPIELRPMTKFPVVRDLIVDRRRLFRALEKLTCWIPVDGYYDNGRGPLQSQKTQEVAYTLSTCMSCGCCLEACPQYGKIELKQHSDESPEAFKQRESGAFDEAFIGAHANSQVRLINLHPTGQMQADRRLDLLMAPGGIQNCGKAGNCEAVCPKEIPLMTSWAQTGRAVTIHLFKKMFGGD